MVAASYLRFWKIPLENKTLPLCQSAWKLLLKAKDPWKLSYSIQKKIQIWTVGLSGGRIYFSEKLPGNFRLITSRKNMLSPLKILQNCVTPLWNSQVKNHTRPRNSDFFLNTPGNSTFFNWTLEYPQAFFKSQLVPRFNLVNNNTKVKTGAEPKFQSFLLIKSWVS